MLSVGSLIDRWVLFFNNDPSLGGAILLLYVVCLYHKPEIVIKSTIAAFAILLLMGMYFGLNSSLDAGISQKVNVQ